MIILKNYILPIFIILLITFAAAFISPFFWLFASAGILLHFLMGISVFLVWQQRKVSNTKTALIFFIIQLALYAIWLVIFFGFHSPKFAFLEIIILWLFILLTLIKFYKINKIAGLLLVPYILWVSFFSMSNFFVWILN